MAEAHMVKAPVTEAPGFRADRRFNHAANDSPRSGSSKRVTPAIWGIVVIGVVALTVWFATGM
jgi:hypothetical protein